MTRYLYNFLKVGKMLKLCLRKNDFFKYNIGMDLYELCQVGPSYSFILLVKEINYQSSVDENHRKKQFKTICGIVVIPTSNSNISVLFISYHSSNDMNFAIQKMLLLCTTLKKR